MASYRLQRDISEEEVYTKELGHFSPLIRNLLVHRGITTREEAEKFITPNYERDICSPFEIEGMKEGVSRIVKAMKHDELIAIYSDYDCDGIPGGALLSQFFDELGYTKRIHYIPHRHNEGYGLHNHAIDTLKNEGVTLIITVDLAITNIDEVAYAKKQGIDVIVTDHHLPIREEDGTQTLPKAFVVLNSKKDSCTYHDKMLCGCALAWKLACGILIELRNTKLPKKESMFKNVLEKVATLPVGWEKWFLDYAGISTIADMVPLVNENRAIAHFGLRVLRRSSRAGLQKMLANAGVKQSLMTEEDIAFGIAPRVNAASRMDDPRVAFNALASRDTKEAIGYANILEELNNKRKRDVGDVIGNLSYDHSHFNEEVIVVGDTSWTPGILGLIAQRILDETGKPTFVWGQGEDAQVYKGSCRSKGDVHVVELMSRAGEVLLGFGGHEEAGGFSFKKGDEDKVRVALNQAVTHVTKKDIGNGEEIVDGILTFDKITDSFFNEIETLAPFGVANPKPLFAFKNVRAISSRAFGKQSNHLEVIYKGDNGKEIKAIMFGNIPKDFPLLNGEHTLLAHLEKSNFAGRTTLRLKARDIIGSGSLGESIE